MSRPGGSRRRETPQAARERRSRVDDPQVVSDAAMRLLEARPRSAGEVRRRLTFAGYPPALVEHAIERLLTVGLLDDLEFARMWVRSRDSSRPRGEQALRRELMQKGLDREVVARVLDERAATEDGATVPADRAAADRLLRRRRASLERISNPIERRRRAYALLARNGFEPDICAEAAARFATSPAASEGE